MLGKDVGGEDTGRYWDGRMCGMGLGLASALREGCLIRPLGKSLKAIDRCE